MSAVQELSRRQEGKAPGDRTELGQQHAASMSWTRPSPWKLQQRGFTKSAGRADPPWVAQSSIRSQHHLNAAQRWVPPRPGAEAGGVAIRRFSCQCRHAAHTACTPGRGQRQQTQSCGPLTGCPALWPASPGWHSHLCPCPEGTCGAPAGNQLSTVAANTEAAATSCMSDGGAV